MTDAKARLASTDDAGATIVLKNILQRNPDDAEARYLLGLQLQKRGEHASALIELERALTLKHARDLVTPALAQSLLAQGQNDKIVAQYASIELPDAMANAELQGVVAQALHAQGHTQRALELMQKAMAAAPASEALQLVHARFTAQSGKIDEAVALLDAFIAKHPESHQAFTMKGNALAVLPDKHDAAVAAYRKTLQLQPKDVVSRTGLIALALKRRDFSTAEQELAELQKVAPKQVNTVFYEAYVAHARGHYMEARTLFQAVLSETPEQPSALIGAAENELRLNNTDLAEKMAARALYHAPQSESAKRLLAMVYLRSGRPARALSTLDALVERADAKPEILSLAAQAQLMNGNASAADQLYSRVAAMKPSDPGLRTTLAIANSGKTGSEQTLQTLERISTEDKGTSADMALISAYLRARQLDRALKAVEVLIKKTPDDALAYQLKAQVLVQSNDMPGAQQALKAALSKDPNYLPAVLALATMDMRSQQPQLARERIEDLIKKQPANAQALVALAELSAELDMAPNVILGYLTRAVSIDRSDPALWTTLIDQQMKLGDVRAALASSQQAVAANPDSLQLLDRLGRAQAHGGQLEQALSTFRLLTKQHPTSLVGLQGEAEVQIASGKLSDAARGISKLLERDPQNLPALGLAFGSAMQQKQYKVALDVARTVQRLRPAEATGTNMEAEVEFGQGRRDNALALWRKSLTLGAPGVAPVRLHQTLTQAGKDADAQALASSWIKAHPEDMGFLEHLAAQARLSGQLAAAEKQYREILSKRPSHLGALNDLAMLLAQQGKPEAVALAEKAVKRAPDNPALLDTLAHALATTKAWATVLETQKRAISLAPNEPSLRLALARFELQSGDAAAAKRSLHAVVNGTAPLSPDDRAAMTALSNALN